MLYFGILNVTFSTSISNCKSVGYDLFLKLFNVVLLPKCYR